MCSRRYKLSEKPKVNTLWPLYDTVTIKKLPYPTKNDQNCKNYTFQFLSKPQIILTFRHVSETWINLHFSNMLHAILNYSIFVHFDTFSEKTKGSFVALCVLISFDRLMYISFDEEMRFKIDFKYGWCLTYVRVYIYFCNLMFHLVALLISVLHQIMTFFLHIN